MPEICESVVNPRKRAIHLLMFHKTFGKCDSDIDLFTEKVVSNPISFLDNHDPNFCMGKSLAYLHENPK